MSQLTIVMYHYVRPILESKFPSIKGLEVNGFKRQLDYLESEFDIVSTEDVIASVKNAKKLPRKACWLTFDDGYKDHFKYVFPELKERGIQGSFFPPRVAIQGNKVLDVNSIHHILASCDNLSKLRNRLDQLCRDASISSLELDRLWGEYGVANRFDDEVTIYIKRMLQHALPEELRNAITSKFFEECVGVSQSTFSKELYMSTSELTQLVNEGMYVGSHGSQHYWLDRISPQDQQIDIKESLAFLEEVGAPTKDWVMCYPYGAFNDDTLSVLRSLGAAVGLTTEVRQANLSADDSLTLPRFDTNDFPH